MNAGRIIVNSPGSIGALGGVYNDMVPTFSFGCGTGGGNSTTDNVNVYHYLNIKRVARRTQRICGSAFPTRSTSTCNAVENLIQFPSRSTIIVTNPALEKIGHVDTVRRSIPPQTHVHVLAIPDAEPEFKVVMQGVEALNSYKADQIIALGGGSVIDAAKIMKLKYESPEADLEELGAPFLDIRKRVVEYPTEKTNRVRLIAISTTSGTGSEVTPFAVLIDKERGRKVTLADYSLSPGRGHCRSAVRHVHAQRPHGRHGHRLSDSRAGGRRFRLRLALHGLQRHAGHPAGIPVSAHRLRPSRQCGGAQHDAQCRMHRGAGLFQRFGGRQPRAGACVRRALRSTPRTG